MKLKPFIISVVIYVMVIYVYYSTDFSIRFALNYLSLFERVTELNIPTKIVLSLSKLFFVGMFVLIYLITKYFTDTPDKK